MKRVNFSTGFSLLELLITITISAILLSLAIASYDSYQKKIYHLDGRNKLLEIMQRQHHYFAEYLTYTDQLQQLGFTSNSGTITSDKQHYRIHATPCTSSIAHCVVLTATPTDSAKDAATLTFDSLGHRTPSSVWK